MKHVIWILENKIIELEKNNSIAVVRLSDKLNEVDKIYYKALKDSTNRIILECKKAIKILSNEREADRKHEQTENNFIQYCPICEKDTEHRIIKACNVCERHL